MPVVSEDVGVRQGAPPHSEVRSAEQQRRGECAGGRRDRARQTEKGLGACGGGEEGRCHSRGRVTELRLGVGREESAVS